VNIEQTIKILEMLLEAEIDAGRAPGVASTGIYDGPKQISCLIEQLNSDENGGRAASIRSLVGSVYGGYLGRGELYWQQGLDRLLPVQFEKQFTDSMRYLMSQKF
jgi:hypothetical protein